MYSLRLANNQAQAVLDLWASTPLLLGHRKHVREPAVVTSRTQLGFCNTSQDEGSQHQGSVWHLRLGDAPHRRTHRQEVVSQEGVAVAPPRQVLARGHAAEFCRLFWVQYLGRISAKAHHIGHHAPEGWTHLQTRVNLVM